MNAGLRLTQGEADAVLYIAGHYPWERDDFEDFAAAEQEAAIRREEYIFSCMKAQGFEYFPAKVNQISWLPWSSVDPIDRTWVEIYGLGYSTTLLPQEVAGEAVGYLGEPPPEPELSEDSAETAYLSSLSDEEYRRYALALTGLDPSELSAFTPASEPDAAVTAAIDESCQGEALAEFPSPEPVAYDTESGELLQRVTALPEWVAFKSEGWRCAREAGIEAFSIESAEQLVAEQLIATGVADRLGELPRSLEPLPPDLARDLGAVQAYEREIAATLWECDIHPIQADEFFVELTRSLVISD